MSPAAVAARLREAGRLTDLRADRRLQTKVDMSPRAVSRRLRSVQDALTLCRKLAARG
jgi:hypothetical protein